MTDSTAAAVSVQRWHKIVAEGVEFAAVANAMEHINMPDSMENAAERMKEAVVGPSLFMATHSGAGREWDLVHRSEGGDPLFLRDSRCNSLEGWYCFGAGDVERLLCVSASDTRSSLEAFRQADGTWNLFLEVPIMDDGKPYMGSYWGAFHWALEIPDPSDEEVPASSPSVKKPKRSFKR